VSRVKKLFIFLAAILLLSGCASDEGRKTEEVKPQEKQESTEAVRPEEELEKIVVYFSDKDAMYLNRFEYEVPEGKDKAEAVIDKIFEGPAPSDHILSAPKEMKKPAVEIRGDTAVVDFDPESSDFYPKGSTGENLFIFSIVNSLTETLGVKKVQFTFGGKRVPVEGSNYDFSTQEFEFNHEIVK
jgi:spore germination protein GerM